MLIRSLPLYTGILPLLATGIAYFLGVQEGILPECIPYLDGCTSISSTGRHPPGSYVFKAVHMPLAAALLFMWYFVSAWLRQLSNDVGRGMRQTILYLGVIGAIASIIYVTFLGTTAPLYEFMRRFGIYFYFIGTLFAQLLTAIALVKISASPPLNGIRRIPSAMLALCAITFALGVLNVILKSILDDPDALENQIEWISVLMMQAWFVLLYVAWKKTGFGVEVATTQT